jgi:hypothetical protein
MTTDLLVSSLTVMLAGAEPREGSDLIGLDLNEVAPLALVALVFAVVPSSCRAIEASSRSI